MLYKLRRIMSMPLVSSITLAVTNITRKYKYNCWEITTFEMDANMHVCAVMSFCTYIHRGSHWYICHFLK